MNAGLRIRPLDPTCGDEVALVAARMRETLVEVLGEARGDAMYTPEWLEDRVRFHLDPGRSTGAVYVAEGPDGAIVGHTIVRVERGEDGRAFGLFSTTYVVPAARRQGVAAALLARGEAWMAAQGLAEAATYTAADNAKLHRLYEAHGYAITARHGEMVALTKALAPPGQRM